MSTTTSVSLVVAAAVLLLATPPALRSAAAQADRATAKQKLREASKLTRQGELEEALVAVDDGLAADPQNLKLLRLRGSILLERRDFEGALAAYEAFLAAGPRGASKRKAQRTVGDLQIVKTTFLEVTVDRGPAKIFIDSKLIGEVCVAEPTCKRGMVPGKYRLYIVRDGFDTVRKRIQLVAGETLTISEAMAENPSTLTVTSTPPDAVISVDGTEVGPAPQTLEVAAGEHAVTATLPGYASAAVTATAALGEPTTAAVVLARAIPIEVATDGATLTLDGTPVQPVDGVLVLADDAVPHELVATKDGFESQTVAIPALPPVELTVRIELVETKPAEPEKPAAPPPSVTRPRPLVVHWIEAGVFAGSMSASNDHEFFDARSMPFQPLESTSLPDVGIRVGYWPLRYLGVEAEASYLTATAADRGDGTLLGLRAHLHGQYRLGRFTPFGVAGAGVLAMRSDPDGFGNDADLVGHYGGGTKVRVTAWLALRLDLRFVLAPRGNSYGGTTTHVEGLFGASFASGGD